MRTWFAICLMLLSLSCAQEGVEVVVAEAPAQSRLLDRGGSVVEEGDFEPLRSHFEPGSEVWLTIDADLQRALELELAPLGGRGSAVLLDARTGAVLAMRRGLEAHPTGSIFKPVTALAGLVAGVIEPEEQVDCQGHVDIGQRRFHCFKSEGHGPLDLKAATATSCNVYALKLGEEVGLARLMEMGRRFGLSSATGIELSEASGRLGEGSEASPGLAAAVAVGHGSVEATPLQMARVYAGLATGALPRVHLVDKVVGPQGQALDIARLAPQSLGLEASDLAAVRAGLRAAVGSPIGTARGIEVDGLAIAGKTGTVSPSSDEPGPDHAWFAGYAPAQDPQVVAVVFVRHGEVGSKAAAPVAQRLLKAALP